MTIAANWPLDPTVLYLNHGSFGACPSPVLAAQAALRLELEREPMDFLAGSLQGRLDAARGVLAAFVGADPTNLAFVPNATTGVNAVLRSLEFSPGDEILVTTHTYNACRRATDYVADRTGARIEAAALPFPCPREDAVVTAVLGAVTARTRLALIDHVTSPTGLVLPLARLVNELARRGVDVLVDGAHAPGMVPLALEELGAAYYTGNAHKWLCAPKGAAFLYVRRDRQSRVHPGTISHGYQGGFQAEFDWTGTADPTPYLCIPEAIRFMAGLLPGGWPEVMAANHALALDARRLVLAAFDAEPPCPEGMIGSMASIPLPTPTPGPRAHALDCKSLHDGLRERGIEAWFHPHPVPLVRLSAQLYNSLDQYRRLVSLLGQALHAA